MKYSALSPPTRLSFTHRILTRGSNGKKRVVTMTTLPLKDPGRGRKKVARGSDNGTMPLSEPLEPYSFFPPARANPPWTADSLVLKILWAGRQPGCITRGVKKLWVKLRPTRGDGDPIRPGAPAEPRPDPISTRRPTRRSPPKREARPPRRPWPSGKIRTISKGPRNSLSRDSR